MAAIPTVDILVKTETFVGRTGRRAVLVVSEFDGKATDVHLVLADPETGDVRKFTLKREES